MDRELIERLATQAGASNEGVGQGGAYREMVLRGYPVSEGVTRLDAIQRFAALIVEECIACCGDSVIEDEIRIKFGLF